MKNNLITIYYNKQKFTIPITKDYSKFAEGMIEINGINEYNYSKLLILFKVNQGEIKQLIDQASYDLFLDYSDFTISIKELHQVLYYIDKQQPIQSKLISNDNHQTHLLPETNQSDLSKIELSKMKDEIVQSLSIEFHQMKRELLSQVSNTQLLSKPNSNNQSHKGITCSICGMNPIKGIRYHCLNCSQFELCDICEEKMGEIHPHALLKIRIPRNQAKNESQSTKNTITNINPSLKEDKKQSTKKTGIKINTIDDMNFFNIK